MRRTFLIILFTINVLNELATASSEVEGCWDHRNPFNSKERTKVPCYSTTTSPKRSNSIRNNGKRDDTNMFDVTLSCLVSDSTLCSKVQNAFNQAGQIITDTLLLNTKVTVNATFVNFCTAYQLCVSSGTIILGGASPARTIQLTDDDGVSRLFPQSLVKQKKLNDPPTFLSYDILALFNSDANFWFDGDGEIAQGQSDFLFVILHELIHGLGFTSGYDDYINQKPEALTPLISVDQSSSSGSFVFEGFVEYIFDKFMVILPTGQRVTEVTKSLNGFGNGNQFDTTTAFISDFKSSSQYTDATDMMKYATTRNSLGLLPVNSTDTSQAIILETSISPYVSGSSVSHFDYRTYTNTSDFLMRYIQNHGVTLNEFVQIGGNYEGGPIGPKLRLFLGWIGYEVQNKSVSIPTAANSDGSKSDARQNYLSMNLSITLLLVTTFFFIWI